MSHFIRYPLPRSSVIPSRGSLSRIVDIEEAEAGATVMVAGTALFDLTGLDADTLAIRFIAADSVSFTLTGQNATTSVGFILNADSVLFDLTGQDADTLAIRFLTADSILFDLTGQVAVTIRTHILSADSDSFTLTGQDATLIVGHLLSADSVSFTLTGQDALLFEEGEEMVAESGSFLLKTATHLSMPGTTGNSPTTPDSAALDIIGDIDIRADLALDNWQSGIEGIVSKQVSDKSYFFRKTQTRIQLTWSEDGTVEIGSVSAEFSFSSETRHSVRATLDVDNGAGGHDLTYYKSETGIDGPWIQVGSVITTAGITNIFSGAGEVRIGSNLFDSDKLTGKVYRVQVRRGINGTIEFDANFNSLPENTTSFTEDSSNAATVTINQSGSPQSEIVGDISFLTTVLLEAESGSFALTGQDATLSEAQAETLEADSGSFTLTGQDATTLFGHLLSADSVTFTLTGQDAQTSISVILTADSVSFTLTGQDATTRKTAHVLSADSASFSLTGQNAGTLFGHLLNADSVSFTLTGQDAITAIGFFLTALSGTFTLTGQDANTIAIRDLNADSGSFILTGQDAQTITEIILSADSGSFILTGQDAITLVARLLSADSGTFTLTGQDATTSTAIILQAESALFDLTGQDAITSLEEVLIGESGSFILTGQLVDLLWSHLLTAATGVFTLVGRDATLLVGYVLNADSGTFTLTGQDAELEKSALAVQAETGVFNLTGQDALFVKDLILIGSSGVFTLTGQLVNTLTGTVIVVPQIIDPNILFPKEVDELVIPTLQAIDFRLSQFKDVELPDPLTVVIDEYNALEPVSPTKEVVRELFLYVDFSNTIQDIIDGKIEELTSEIKPYEVETHEWSREKEDMLSATEEQVEKLFDVEAAKGFLCTSGVFDKDVSKFASKVKRELSRLNEKLYSAQTDLTKKNIASGLEAGNRAEAVVRTTDKNRQSINLEAAQFLIDVDFKVFEVHLTHHTQTIEVKKIKHLAYIERIKGQLLKLQESEIALKSHTLNQIERTKQVEMFNLAADFLNAQQGLKEIELENFIIRSEIEKNKLLKFQAEIDKFSSIINLNISKFNLYKAGIEFEESKVDRFKEEADVAGAQLDLQNAKTRSGSIRAETKLAIGNANLQSQAELLRAARSRLDIAVTEGRAVTIRFSSDVLEYQALLKEWITEAKSEISGEMEESQSLSDLVISELKDSTRTDVNTIQFNTESSNIRDLGNLNAQVIAESADISAKTTITSKLIHELAGG